MAYGLEYQSNFYNYFQKLCSVKIYQRDYTEGVTQVRTSEIKITANYNDDNTPIIGTGARIVIVTEDASLQTMEDLLLSYERQFLCTIEYGGDLAFQGYSICDLNERQLLPYTEVVMQFTDYMHRLEGEYPDCLKNMALNTNLFTLIHEFIHLTTLELPLYVNSTLFEINMNTGETDTWLPQVFVQNANYFETSYNRDDVFAAINKTLQPFSAFIYYYNGKWVIERQEDITRTGDWVMYDGEGASSVVNGLKQTINKQIGDFQYLDCSQIIEYDSGLHTLTLRLRDKELDSQIFNNWPQLDLIPTLANGKPPEDLIYRTWYVHDDILPSQRGTERHSINEWVHYANVVSDFTRGWVYQFIVYFNTTESSYPVVEPSTILSISYKMASDKTTADTWTAMIPFFLLINEGTYSGYYIKIGGAITDSDLGGRNTASGINLIGPESYWHLRIQEVGMNNEVFDVSDQSTDWTITKEFDFSASSNIRIYNVISGGYTLNYGSLEALLGYPEFIKLAIVFLPMRYTNGKHDNIDGIGYCHIYPDNYLGDIIVKVGNVDKIDNKIQYYLNENFVKTDEIDLYLFDMPNMNYSNAMLENDGFTRTKEWVSENSPDSIPLYEIFGKGKFRKYGRTIHRLKGTILCDKILKVFTIITDDNLLAQVITEGESGGLEGGGFDDWYLPSETELGYMYTNLYPAIGGFAGAAYWSSTKSITYPATMAYIINFSNGIHASVDKTYNYHVRAIRSFSESGTYNLGDEGPAGGWICYVSGTDYLEAALSDQSTSANWADAVTISEELGSVGGTDMKFLLNGFNWDVNKGTYEIEAEEYTEEDILVGIVGDDEEGNPVPPGYELPAIPTGLTGWQYTPGSYIIMSWDVVAGAVGYVLERKPVVFNGYWVDRWEKVKWSGSEILFNDHIELVIPSIPDDSHVTYRVSAYNDKGSGKVSDEIIVHWYSG